MSQMVGIFCRPMDWALAVHYTEQTDSTPFKFISNGDDMHKTRPLMVSNAQRISAIFSVCATFFFTVTYLDSWYIIVCIQYALNSKYT